MDQLIKTLPTGLDTTHALKLCNKVLVSEAYLFLCPISKFNVFQCRYFPGANAISRCGGNGIVCALGHPFTTF